MVFCLSFTRQFATQGSYGLIWDTVLFSFFTNFSQYSKLATIVPQMAFIHCTIIASLPLFAVVTKGPQNPGSILSSNSNRNPLIFMTAILFSFSTRVWMNALWLSITSISLFSSAYIIQENSRVLVAIVGELEQSLDMNFLYIFPTATVIPLILPSLFSLRNM